MKLTTLRETALIKTYLSYYTALADRERLALHVLAAFLLTVLLITQLLLPAFSFNQKAQASYQEALDNYTWMVNNPPTTASINTTSANRLQDASLISMVTSSARAKSLALKRYDAVEDNQLRVVVDNQPFKQLLAWLEIMQANYGIAVIEISVDKQQNTGLINARVLLQG